MRRGPYGILVAATVNFNNFDDYRYLYDDFLVPEQGNHLNKSHLPRSKDDIPLFQRIP